VSSELSQVLVGGKQSVLNRILGIGRIAQKSISYLVKRR
jgi:hypothetical protein